MGRSWTEDEDQLLRDNYGTLTPQEIADRIGRTRDLVVWRAGTLGLRKPRNPPWSDAENKFLRDNYPRMLIEDIGAHLGRSYTAVQHQADRSGISKIGNPGSAWTDDEEELLRDLYGTMPPDRLASLLGRTTPAVVHRAMKMGANKRPSPSRSVRLRVDTVLTMRRDAVRQDYFAQVDSPMKAYLLGWLASDGNVKTIGNTVRLRVNSKDEEILHLFRDEIAPLHKVGRYQAPRPSGEMSTMSRFEVASARMKQDLIRLGVTPNKSLTLQYPPIPPHLDNSFILGYFDGDGCLTRNGRQWKWTIHCASSPFLVAVQERIEDATGLRPRGPHPRPPSLAWTIGLNGSNVPPVDAWLHADIPGLARKRIQEAA
jgi:hypothetical protein